MAVWEDRQELARRIAGAQAYFGEDQEQFAKRINRSGRTLRKILDAEPASIGRTPEARRQLVDLLVRSGCPPEWFGLSAQNGAAEAEMQNRLTELEDTLVKVRADLSTALFDLADARKRQGLPEHAREQTGG